VFIATNRFRVREGREADFERSWRQAWTRSEAFRKAHSNARSPEGVLAGHPKLEGFEVVI
jgi:heme-degrading monooxygenase HmoA